MENPQVKKFPVVATSDVEKVRFHIFERFSFLLRHQTRIHIFRDNIEVFVDDFLSEMKGLVRENQKCNASVLMELLARLRQGLRLLFTEQKQWLNESKTYIQAVISQVNGITTELATTVTALDYFSSHDPLTGLHNRRYFNEMLDYEISRSARHHHAFTILSFDIDNFKAVNDTYGHPCGDLVLQGLSKMIQFNVRKGDIAVRMGGDEFSVILMETDQKGGKHVAEKLRHLIEKNSFTDHMGQSFHITVSIGVISYPKNATQAEELMTFVDVCLYRAKAAGKNRIYTLRGKEHLAKDTTFIISQNLREALQENRIVPYFQPILDCNTGEIFAYEVLARLLEPGGKVVPAALFIEAIEKYGLSRLFHQIIIQKALEIYKQAVSHRKHAPHLFINLSVSEIEDGVILDTAQHLCHEFGILPSKIVFEVLEREVIKDQTRIKNLLTHFRQQGFAFALDDFGIGYNTFHYLHDPFFKYVKIDGSFVRNILTSKVDHAFVRSIHQLCQELGFITIAEFIESEAILKEVKAMGIPYAQGFHTGMPQPKFYSR